LSPWKLRCEVAGELGKQGGGVALNMLRGSEHAAGLCERRAAKLAGPLVDVLEDEVMELLKMAEVVSALQADLGELYQS
jgi:hypothetical protein